jgi:hypothetical protein
MESVRILRIKRLLARGSLDKTRKALPERSRTTEYDLTAPIRSSEKSEERQFFGDARGPKPQISATSISAASIAEASSVLATAKSRPYTAAIMELFSTGTCALEDICRPRPIFEDMQYTVRSSPGIWRVDLR